MEAVKRLILVTSPPACGKTRLSRRLSTALRHVVYLDKDSLIPLSKQIFKVAGEPYNRSSAFFQKEIRDYEYEVIVDIGLEALKYDDTVLINAPFTRDIRDAQDIAGLKARLAEVGATLTVVWIVTDPEVCHQRMLKRNSDRDTWKLANWEEYIQTVDFSVPKTLELSDSGDGLILYHNSTDEMADASFARLLSILEP